VQTIAAIPATCAPLSAEAISAEDADQLAGVLRAIAEPARLRLFSLIHALPGQETCVCNLQEPLGLSQPTVSHHLKVLVGAGLLERERRGRWAYYHVVTDHLDTLRHLLA
jgi:ArsR family transcriptional regulator